MAVSMKRSDGICPPECEYGCCTEIYGKNVKAVRRRIRKRARQEARRVIAQEDY